MAHRPEERTENHVAEPFLLLVTEQAAPLLEPGKAQQEHTE